MQQKRQKAARHIIKYEARLAPKRSRRDLNIMGPSRDPAKPDSFAKKRGRHGEDFDPEEDQALLDQEVPKPGDPNYVDPNADTGEDEDDNEPVRND